MEGINNKIHVLNKMFRGARENHDHVNKVKCNRQK